MNFKGLKKAAGMKGQLLSGLACALVIFTTVANAEESGLSEHFFESDAARARRLVEEKQRAEALARATEEEEAPLAIGSVVASDNPQSHITPPDARAQMRINPEAPGPFVGLATAYFQGDMPTARAYSKQFVQYLSDLMFAVKDITRLIGEAMVEAKQIKEEDWDGVEQYLDYELAKSREESGGILKVTHEDALRKIVPDPKGEVEIYYFFTLNSEYSRKMAPQVERLWRTAKRDSKIKMVGLTLGPQPKEWVESYKRYTGLTLPVMNGELAAKAFNLKFVPAIIVVTPNNPAAYVRTGQSDFSRLYQFVRKAQGLDTTLDSEAQKLIQAKIGSEGKEPKEIEKAITKFESQKGVSLVRTSTSEISSLREKVKALSF